MKTSIEDFLYNHIGVIVTFIISFFVAFVVSYMISGHFITHPSGKFDVEVIAPCVGDDGLINTSTKYDRVDDLIIRESYTQFDYKGKRIIVKDTPIIINQVD